MLLTLLALPILKSRYLTLLANSLLQSVKDSLRQQSIRSDDEVQNWCIGYDMPKVSSQLFDVSVWLLNLDKHIDKTTLSDNVVLRSFFTGKLNTQ